MAAGYARRLPVLAVGVPTLIALVFAVLLLASLPTLPPLVSVHWTATGAAGKTAPPAMALVALPASIAFGVLVWAVLRRPQNVRSAAAPRILTGASVFFATVVSGGVTGSLLIAARSGGLFPWAVLVAAVVLGAALGALAGALLPAPASAASRRSADVEPLPLGRTERALWVGRAAPSAAIAGLLLVVSGVLAALAVLLGVLVAPVLLVLLLPALAAAAASSGWRVRIDEHGVAVHGALPPFVLRLALEEIDAARITSVAPVSDFGGWGPRRRHGVTAIVSQAGEALELQRTDGRRLLVTVAGAVEAAALLTALLARRRPVPQAR
jgi:hypothetical protein